MSNTSEKNIAVTAARNQVIQEPPVTDTVNDITALPNLIKTWKTLNDEVRQLNEAKREKTKRLKALEEMILQSMKRNNYGALELQNSGGRILYRRKQAKESLGPKNLAKLLTDYMKSEQEANKVLKFLEDNRGSKVKESLLYETD